MVPPCLLCNRPDLVSQRQHTSHPEIIGLIPESDSSTLACLQGIGHMPAFFYVPVICKQVERFLTVHKPLFCTNKEFFRAFTEAASNISVWIFPKGGSIAYSTN